MTEHSKVKFPLIKSLLAVLALSLLGSDKKSGQPNEVRAKIADAPSEASVNNVNLSEADKQFFTRKVMGVYGCRKLTESLQARVSQGQYVPAETFKSIDAELDTFMKEIVSKLNALGMFPKGNFSYANGRFNVEVLNNLLDEGLLKDANAKTLSKQDLAQIKGMLLSVQSQCRALGRTQHDAFLVNEIKSDIDQLQQIAWEKGLLDKSKNVEISTDQFTGGIRGSNVRLFDFIIQEMNREELKAMQGKK